MSVVVLVVCLMVSSLVLYYISGWLVCIDISVVYVVMIGLLLGLLFVMMYGDSFVLNISVLVSVLRYVMKLLVWLGNSVSVCGGCIVCVVVSDVNMWCSVLSMLSDGSVVCIVVLLIVSGRVGMVCVMRIFLVWVG